MVSLLDCESFCSYYSSGFVILVLHYINKMKTILWGHGQLFGVLEFVCFSLGFVIIVLHYINNMKTILAGNANAFLKNQINDMERKIYSTPYQTDRYVTYIHISSVEYL